MVTSEDGGIAVAKSTKTIWEPEFLFITHDTQHLSGTALVELLKSPSKTCPV